jgi:hypothetical protein
MRQALRIQMDVYFFRDFAAASLESRFAWLNKTGWIGPHSVPPVMHEQHFPTGFKNNGTDGLPAGWANQLPEPGPQQFSA